MVWYSPVLVIEGHCQAWFWRSRASTNHRCSTCASPVMHASQGILWVIFRGSFGWFWFFWAGCSKSSFFQYNIIGFPVPYISRLLLFTSSSIIIYYIGQIFIFFNKLSLYITSKIFTLTINSPSLIQSDFLLSY